MLPPMPLLMMLMKLLMLMVGLDLNHQNKPLDRLLPHIHQQLLDLLMLVVVGIEQHNLVGMGKLAL